MPETDGRKIQELDREIQNLKIANEVKAKFIELMKNERVSLIDKLQSTSRTWRQLETKILRHASEKSKNG